MKGIPAPEASIAVYDAFLVLPLLVVVALWFLYRRVWTEEREGLSPLGFGAALFVWIWTTGGLGLSGVLRRFDLVPPPFAFLILGTIAAAVFTGLSRAGETLARAPLALLVGLNAFRFPLDLAMHQAAVEKVMPEQMSFTGYNFDIVTGVTAILLAPLVTTGVVPRAVVLIWNVMGPLLLANVVTIA